jgi:hypothetical protein
LCPTLLFQQLSLGVSQLFRIFRSLWHSRLLLNLLLSQLLNLLLNQLLSQLFSLSVSQLLSPSVSKLPSLLLSVKKYDLIK